MERRIVYFWGAGGEGVDGVFEGETVDACRTAIVEAVRIAALSATRVNTAGPVGRSARSRVMIPAMTTSPAAN